MASADRLFTRAGALSGTLYPPCALPFFLPAFRASVKARKNANGTKELGAHTGGPLVWLVLNKRDFPTFKWLEGQEITLDGKPFIVDRVLFDPQLTPIPTTGTKIGLFGRFL